MLSIDHDLHVHTHLSLCCHDPDNHTPRRILAVAERMGTRTIGFADHLWVNPALRTSDWYARQGAGQISRLREELAAVATGVRVLVGCEAETVAPGQFGITPEFAASLDFVLLACSHLHMRDLVRQPPSDRPRDVGVHVLELFRSAAGSGLATAIPHPFRPFGHDGQYDAIIAAISDAEFLDAFALAAGRGVGIEIPTGFLPPEPTTADPPEPTWSIETPLRVLSLAKDAGCKFLFATDAHDLAMLQTLPSVRRLAEALRLTEDDILPLARGGP